MAKTHAGVHAAFVDIARSAPALDDALRGFLSRASYLKALADDETDLAAATTIPRAQTALEDAQRFVSAVAALIGRDGDPAREG